MLLLIRALLLRLFQQWGLPKAIRTDNGAPFGVPTRDVVPILSLWLMAWGIQPILNRPRRPQDNPNVECNQGTSARWAEVEKCQSVTHLQQQLDQACAFQRDSYRVRRIGNKSRKEVFAQLYVKKRPFEQAHFDINKAYQHLAKVVYPRKISANGVFVLYGKRFQAGLPYKGQVVFVTFDSEKIAWTCLDKHKGFIKSFPDERFSENNLFNLTFYQ
jgi:hypothetical protein